MCFETVFERISATFDSGLAATYLSTAVSCCMTTAVPAGTEVVCLTVLNVSKQYGNATSFKQGHVVCYTAQLGAEMYLQAIDLMVVVHMHC